MLGDFPATYSLIESLKLGGVVREYRNRSQPGPLGNITLRPLDLREAVRCGSIQDPKDICEIAMGIDKDLESWTTTLSPEWSYITSNANESPSSDCYDGKKHSYRSQWTAQIWINWRVHRILANQIILQNDLCPGIHCEDRISLIQELSTDICISVSSFMGSPRKYLRSD